MDTIVSSPPPQLSHHVVQAGAGAGKTRSLVEKVVSVFKYYRETENRNPRMIVTTFTRKATQELRERLIVRACEVRDADLLEYVGNARSLHISTIHGVLNLFLGQVGHLCQLEAGFRVIHDTEERQIARVALKKTLLSAKEYLAWVEDYSFQQLLSTLIRFSKALQQDPMMQPASLEDIQRIRFEAVSDWRRELNNIALEILETPAEDPKWTDFAHTLKNLASHWDGSITALEAVEKPRKNAKSALPVEIQEEVADQLNKIKKEVNDAGEFEEFWPYFAQKWAEFYDLGRRFHHEFRQAKLSEGLLSISDLEMFSLEVLRENPELGGNFSLGWDFWLIDEYQDTSPVQAELLQLLRGQAPAFVVGDPQQSIYLFRGARSEIFHEKIEEAKRTNSQVDRLMVNYRSEPALLEFLNDFFAGYSEQFEPMQPRQPVGTEQKLVASFISGTNEDEESAGILSHIAKLLRQGARYEDICLLARTHSHLADLATILKSQGIPVQVHSPTGFWRRREVLDAMSLLKFLVHPHDNLTLLALLRSPGYRIDDSILADFSEKRPGSLWNDFLANPEFSKHPSVLQLQELLKYRKENGLVAAFERALRDSALIDLAFHSDPSGRREANLWKLLAKVRIEEKKPGFQILALFDEIDRMLGDEGTAEGDAITAKEPNCVNLMTIHSSKGLEFDHVIVPRIGVSPNLSTSDEFSHHQEDSLFSFPIYLEQEGQRISSVLDRRRLSELRRRELSEQDRWLYVALTRAKKSLALCWSDDKIENHSWAQRGRMIQAARFTRSEKYSAEVLRPPFSYEFAGQQVKRSNEVKPLWKIAKAIVTENQTVSQLTRAETHLTTKILLARQEGATYGIAMHRAFQALKVKPDLAWAIKAHPELAESLEFVWTLNEPPLKQIILNGQAEWGFRIRNGSETLQGRIDLWGRDDQGRVWIVDYKSGRAREDESYWEQLKHYAGAVKRFGNEGEIYLALIHPLDKKVFTKKI